MAACPINVRFTPKCRHQNLVCVTFGVTTPAAWRYSPQFAVPHLWKAAWWQVPRGYDEQMTGQNALANAKRLFKALAAREAYLDEPIPNIRITDVAVQIGLEGDEFDLALDYAADQGWYAEVGDSGTWVSLTPAGVAVAKS